GDEPMIDDKMGVFVLDEFDEEHEDKPEADGELECCDWDLGQEQYWVALLIRLVNSTFRMVFGAVSAGCGNGGGGKCESMRLLRSVFELLRWSFMYCGSCSLISICNKFAV